VALVTLTWSLAVQRRFLHFVVLLVRKLQQDTVCTLYDAASGAYSASLQPYHGFIASTAFTVRGALPIYQLHAIQ
jgi:hypothetical protein